MFSGGVRNETLPWMDKFVHFFPRILLSLFAPNLDIQISEACLELSKTSNMELFAKIVKTVQSFIWKLHV